MDAHDKDEKEKLFEKGKHTGRRGRGKAQKGEQGERMRRTEGRVAVFYS